MHDDYSGLSRAYTTAPGRAIQEILFSVDELYAAVDVSADALKKHQACETESVEVVLTRASRELYQLQQEVKTLLNQLEGGADDEQ